MSNPFERVSEKGGVEESEKEGGMLGPTYNYVKHIKTPRELGMTSSPSFIALADDVSGLLSYIELLTTGTCKLGKCAGKNVDETGRTIGNINGPLGNKFFVETGIQCKDIATEKAVKRSIYVNNVPDGAIPLLSNISGNIRLGTFKGLIPGLLGNIAQIHPTQILLAFTSGSNPPCQQIKMETIDNNGAKKLESGYLTNSDIDIMPDSWFPNQAGFRKRDYDLTATVSESFTDKGANNVPSKNDNKTAIIDYSKMPNDYIIRFYYSMLGLLGLYILLRLMLKKK